MYTVLHLSFLTWCIFVILPYQWIRSLVILSHISIVSWRMDALLISLEPTPIRLLPKLCWNASCQGYLWPPCFQIKRSVISVILLGDRQPLVQVIVSHSRSTFLPDFYDTTLSWFCATTLVPPSQSSLLVPLHLPDRHILAVSSTYGPAPGDRITVSGL